MDYKIELLAAINSAKEFKYLLDIAPPGHLQYLLTNRLKDARESETYKEACRLLIAADSASDNANAAAKPRKMAFFAVPIGDVVTKDCSDTALNLADLLAKISVRLPKLSFEISQEPSSGGVETGLFGLADFSASGLGNIFKVFEAKVNVIHKADSCEHIWMAFEPLKGGDASVKCSKCGLMPNAQVHRKNRP